MKTIYILEYPSDESIIENIQRLMDCLEGKVVLVRWAFRDIVSARGFTLAQLDEAIVVLDTVVHPSLEKSISILSEHHERYGSYKRALSRTTETLLLLRELRGVITEANHVTA